MKISFSIAALVLAVASVATAAPAPAPGRTPSPNPVTGPIDEQDVRPAPPEVIKILKKIGWLSANYKHSDSGPSNPSLKPTPRGNTSPKNNTQAIEKRQSANCRSSSLYWFERHYVHPLDDLERDEMAEHWFRLLVSPNLYDHDINPARSKGAPPKFWESKMSDDGRYGITHDWNYKSGEVTLTTHYGQRRVYTLKNNWYTETEDGWYIITNRMFDCLDWPK
ncbi:hypothetical protein BGZ96_005966 [Linnemannia gamsii]|uniref:Uncharacterized protein n=1 Tax=Linnemannia gamsii TaxID=64522 RepID=A0ABQ7K4E0_9FUNG|nr:hypothetical protein BGZ96_005966 [Linnemannia gamsii]